MAVGALPLGLDPLVAEANRRAWRRRLVGFVGVAIASVAAGTTLALRPSAGPAAQTYRADGIRVRVPAGWFFTRRHLTGVTWPVQRFVVSSFRIPSVPVGTFVPPQSGVLAQILEQSPPISGEHWKPRPAELRFGRLGGMETYGGRRWDEFVFRLAGRQLYAFAWVGSRSTAEERQALLSILKRMHA